MIDEQSPASGHDYASNRWAIEAGQWCKCFIDGYRTTRISVLSGRLQDYTYICTGWTVTGLHGYLHWLDGYRTTRISVLAGRLQDYTDICTGWTVTGLHGYLYWLECPHHQSHAFPITVVGVRVTLETHQRQQTDFTALSTIFTSTARRGLLLNKSPHQFIFVQ